MIVQARTLFFRGLGVGLVLAGVGGATLFWLQGHRDAPQVVRIAPDRVETPTERVTSEDLQTVQSAIERLKGDRTDFAQHSARINHELTLLRSQLIQLDQKQAFIVRDIAQLTSAGLAGAPGAPGAAESAVPERLPAEELERAEAETRAQVEFLAQTLRTEKTDVQWAHAAELALEETFRNEAMAGFEFVSSTCRTTICRLEFHLDASTSPDEGFYSLLRLRPWQSYGFALIDNQGFAVVYLAREGHSFPQLR